MLKQLRSLKHIMITDDAPRIIRDQIDDARRSGVITEKMLRRRSLSAHKEVLQALIDHIEPHKKVPTCYSVAAERLRSWGKANGLVTPDVED